MGVVKTGALDRYSLRMGRLVERHLAEAALIAARQEAEREADQAKRAKAEIEVTAAALREEIKMRRTMQRNLAYLASHDKLTGLPNRAWFGETLREAVEAAAKSGLRLAVLYIDLDNFKDVNDTLGHEVGDSLLQQVAERLTAGGNETAAAARIGGDEFALILPALDADAGATAIALGESLIAALGQPFAIDGRPIFIGASVGVSLYPDDAATVDLLQRHADLALYRAKTDGRNRCQLFDQTLNEAVHRRSFLEQALREPMLHKQLLLAFQPQMDLSTGRISGVEALLRWKHPAEGLIRPSEFIPIAERTGMIIDIGEWALRESCAQAVRWRKAGLVALTISVNVSALQFRVGNLPALVAQVLEETGLPGTCLELEITETAIMNHAADPAAALVALHRQGVKLAIDDFGTGYSSLSYLRQIPVDRIKIDQSFIRDAPGNEDACAVARTIVQLAHSLRLQVVAEGVETAAQLDFVRETGCRFAQGYYFSKPVAANALRDLAGKLNMREQGE
jgi:diguanylate cyclase (GGDEF)-like protein